MNADDIIRKLQCCGNQMYSCTDKRCKAKTLGDAVELINRQRAEIERLEGESSETFHKWEILAERTKDHYAELYEEAKEVVRAKAIKEFAERLKSIRKGCSFTFYSTNHFCETIDNLMKELTEEQNGNL